MKIKKLGVVLLLSSVFTYANADNIINEYNNNDAQLKLLEQKIKIKEAEDKLMKISSGNYGNSAPTSAPQGMQTGSGLSNYNPFPDKSIPLTSSGGGSGSVDTGDTVVKLNSIVRYDNIKMVRMTVTGNGDDYEANFKKGDMLPSGEILKEIRNGYVIVGKNNRKLYPTPSSVKKD